MIEMHNEIIGKLRSRGGREGRELIDHVKNSLFIFLRTIRNVSTTVQARDMLEVAYSPQFFLEFQPYLNHYFRQLYHIFKFIHLSELDDDRKKFYASITRSTLSQNELFLIAFNSIMSEYGKPKMLFLVKHYNILKNFSQSDIEFPIYWTLIKEEIEKVTEPDWTKSP